MIINIDTKSQTIIKTLINPQFSFDELPYGAIGYRNNGSSTASPESLLKYWEYVDTLLLELNIDTSDYITLKSITLDNKFYGVFI